MAEFHSKIKTIEWVDNYSKMVDQTVLPYEFKYVKITTGQGMFDAIKTMIVRGAPDVKVINPGFDVTPHELIAGIITEKGILRPDYKTSIAEAFAK